LRLRAARVHRPPECRRRPAAAPRSRLRSGPRASVGGPQTSAGPAWSCSTLRIKGSRAAGWPVDDEFAGRGASTCWARTCGALFRAVPWRIAVVRVEGRLPFRQTRNTATVKDAPCCRALLDRKDDRKDDRKNRSEERWHDQRAGRPDRAGSDVDAGPGSTFFDSSVRPAGNCGCVSSSSDAQFEPPGAACPRTSRSKLKVQRANLSGGPAVNDGRIELDGHYHARPPTNAKTLPCPVSSGVGPARACSPICSRWPTAGGCGAAGLDPRTAGRRRC